MDKMRISSEVLSPRAQQQQQRELQRLLSQSNKPWQIQATCVPNEGLCFDDFLDRQEIGKGKDSRIYSCKCAKIAPHSIVVKAYDKSKVTDVKIRSIKREARMMNYLTLQNVPNITVFITAFQDEERMYIVMEHCAGGDLLEQLLKEGRAMRERRVVHEVALPLLHTLRYMHALGIIHRDIKLENIFVDESKRIKLGDFGLAMSMQEERAISPVGTLEYMAPETVKLPPAEMIIKGKIKPEEVESVNEKVDIWALGVTIFELVTGRSPFEGDDKAKVKKAIMEGNMRAMPGFVSADCADFITRMMQYDVRLRPSAEELLQHPWLLKNLQSIPQPTPSVVPAPQSCPASPRTSFQMPVTPVGPPAALQNTAMLSTAGLQQYQLQQSQQQQQQQAMLYAAPQAVQSQYMPPPRASFEPPPGMMAAAAVVVDQVSAAGMIGSHNHNAYTYSTSTTAPQQYQQMQASLQYSTNMGAQQYNAAGGVAGSFPLSSTSLINNGGNPSQGVAAAQYGAAGAAATLVADVSRQASRLAQSSMTTMGGMQYTVSPMMMDVNGTPALPAGQLQYQEGMDNFRSQAGGGPPASSRDSFSGQSSPRAKRKMRLSQGYSARQTTPGDGRTGATPPDVPSSIFERMSQFFSKRLLRKERGGSSGVSSPHEMDMDPPGEYGIVAAKMDHMFMGGAMNGNGSMTQGGSFVLKVPSVSTQNNMPYGHQY